MNRKRHGISRYRAGCRCDICRSAKHASYVKHRGPDIALTGGHWYNDRGIQRWVADQ